MLDRAAIRLGHFGPRPIPWTFTNLLVNSRQLNLPLIIDIDLAISVTCPQPHIFARKATE
jgi:hypothetical protein